MRSNPQSKGVVVTNARCPGRVVDILEACGAFDPGSSPGRGVILYSSKGLFFIL
jgi:hypothetical protein